MMNGPMSEAANTMTTVRAIAAGSARSAAGPSGARRGSGRSRGAAARAAGDGDRVLLWRRIVPCPEPSRRAHPDASWAALVKHRFGLDVLECPRCTGWLRFVAVLHDRDKMRRLLDHETFDFP